MNDDRCPNHPDPKCAPLAALKVGARFYCMSCAYFLLSAVAPAIAAVAPRSKSLCANPTHSAACCA